MEHIDAFGFVVIVIAIMAGWRHYSILGINKDLLKTKEQLKQSEYFSKTIIETEPECVKITDADGNLIFMNRAGLDMIEAESLEQVKGTCVCPLVTSEYRDEFMKLTKDVCNGGSGIFTEMVGLKEDACGLKPVRSVRNEKDEINGFARHNARHHGEEKSGRAIAAEKERWR
jgi:PAS domain-containing protein